MPLRRVNPQRGLPGARLRTARRSDETPGRPRSISKLEDRSWSSEMGFIPSDRSHPGEGNTDSSFIPEVCYPPGSSWQAMVEEEINIETAFMRLTKGYELEMFCEELGATFTGTVLAQQV